MTDSIAILQTIIWRLAVATQSDCAATARTAEQIHQLLLTPAPNGPDPEVVRTALIVLDTFMFGDDHFEGQGLLQEAWDELVALHAIIQAP